jgi:cytochrome c peroxidase
MPDVALDARGADAAADASGDSATRGDADPWCGRDAPVSYPAGPFAINDGDTLPDLRFGSEQGGELALHQYFAPCAATPRLLVVRVMAAWSGPARWQAAHTAEIVDAGDRARVSVLDLLVLGQDDLPATPADLRVFRARYDAAPDALAADPAYEFQALFLGIRQLPIVALVDTRTMRLARVLVVPALDEMRYEVGRALAAMDGRAAPPRPARVLHDGRFTDDEWDQIRAMTPLPAAPPDPTNRYADDPGAAALGTALFADAALSSNAAVSCASCHAPERAYTDGRPVGVGVATGNRNTPTVLHASHSRWLFWDGRADSLWSQALGPIENPVEMASSRLRVAHAIATRYAAQYEAVFGSLPPLADAARFPADGRPGDGAWEAMAPADRDAVNRVFANVGKSLEAYERTLSRPATPLDAYAAGNADALTPAQRDGLRSFFDFGCIQCHHGPLLTDDSFHNVGMPTGRADGAGDTGRIDAIATLLASPFRADGTYSDAPDAGAGLAGLAPVEAMRGQFHTPSLRVSALTGPWGHGGSFETLEAVMVHYAQRGEGVDVTGSVGTTDIHLSGFHQDAATIDPLVAFLHGVAGP